MSRLCRCPRRPALFRPVFPACSQRRVAALRPVSRVRLTDGDPERRGGQPAGAAEGRRRRPPRETQQLRQSSWRSPRWPVVIARCGLTSRPMRRSAAPAAEPTTPTAAVRMASATPLVAKSASTAAPFHDPEATLRKMATAALAPTPSAQDRRVAAQAAAQGSWRSCAVKRRPAAEERRAGARSASPRRSARLARRDPGRISERWLSLRLAQTGPVPAGPAAAPVPTVDPAGLNGSGGCFC